eukprot:m.255793 g.255793  ORF g.255793 m.255793 type:complete len:320 (+) comp15508_c0_seq1:179-1138(+)
MEALNKRLLCLARSKRFVAVAEAKELLEQGADVSCCDSKGITPLHYAAFHNNAPMIRLLASYGSDLNLMGHSLYQRSYCSPGTPLVQAARKGNFKCVEVLLEHGADVEMHTGLTATPLVEAARLNRKRVLQLLLDHGASPNQKLSTTPLLVAVRRGHEVCVKLLLQHKADPNMGNPAWIASRTGKNRILHLLLRYGAEATDKCLLIATRNAKRESVALLLTHGLTPSIMDRYGQTPLHEASFSTSVACVVLLLLAGADPKLVDKSGRTARDCVFARHMGSVGASAELLDTLQQGGTLFDWARNGHRKAVLTQCLAQLIE